MNVEVSFECPKCHTDTVHVKPNEMGKWVCSKCGKSFAQKLVPVLVPIEDWYGGWVN